MNAMYRAYALAVLITMSGMVGVLGHCANHCSGHGDCNTNTEVRCACWDGWTGGDCSKRICPTGLAWTDYVTANDQGHALAECSNRGICDYSSGVCKCQPGFEGLACQQMSCPADCNGHGRCVSMRRNAIIHMDNNFAYTYNSNWDANKVYGCFCDDGFEGYDCSLRQCARGDDPMTTNQVNEIQLVKCIGTGGYFHLFVTGSQQPELRRSGRIAYDASTSDVQAALQGIVGATTVTFPHASASTPCDADGNIMQIEFLDRFGDVPRLAAPREVTDHLTGTGASITVADGILGSNTLSDADATVYAATQGTKEWKYCSGRGMCNQNTGLCECYTGYVSSNGDGQQGTDGDCGFPEDAITSCPGVDLECSGHGVCSDSPSYECACDEGWMGGDCNERVCPSAPAWFDAPTANNVAHADAECSNRGICDRLSGKCVCESGFEGDACQRTTCNAENVCSSHGHCMTMANLALWATNNGVETDFTYGETPGEASVWDHGSMTGCHCSEGYHGYDCSLRTCPTGDDPKTTGLDEVQTFVCDSTPTGTETFTMTFRQQTTAALKDTSTNAQIKAALEALTSITTVTVTSVDGTGTGFCNNAGTNTLSITFDVPNGNVPAISVDTSGISTGSAPPISVTELTPGTTEDVECSNRGICNEVTGLCHCFLGYGASDGNGGAGTIDDCGHLLAFVPVSRAEQEHLLWKVQEYAAVRDRTAQYEGDAEKNW